VITLTRQAMGEEELLSLALEAGADDLQTDDPEMYSIITEPNMFEQVYNTIKAKIKVEPESAEVTMVPKNSISIEGKPAEQLLKLLDALDDQDDVQKVHANFDISDEQMDKLRKDG
jgi:transcriptional/translational regulatory protein YebC/TACO1